MAGIAVFASGRGSNFQAIGEAMAGSEHRIELLVCDRKKALVNQLARNMGVPVRNVSYLRNSREEVEGELEKLLKEQGVELIVLAGYMRLLGRGFIDAFPGRIINIHPSLLPRYPGTRGIEESYDSGDPELGITIHYVDYGMDTGPMILQKRILRREDESLESVKERIHGLEHRWYPEVILDLLNEIDKNKTS